MTPARIRRWISQYLLLACLLLVGSPWASAQTSNLPQEDIETSQVPVAEGSSSQIGRGPTDITKELEEEEQIQQSTSSFAERPFLQDWYDFKDRLEREHHFQFGIAYSAL